MAGTGRNSTTFPDKDRSFEPITITENRVQTTKIRFGREFEVADFTLQISGNNYDDGCFENAFHSLLPFENFRNGLTAFSQDHNIYFVAVRNQIFIYRPRNLDQALPGQPDLVLRPPSLTGLPKRRSICRSRPHCVNNITTAYLGTQEILLMGFDDGDVYAYYTNDVQAYMQKREVDPNLLQLLDIRPLFKHNCIESVWGLACHTHSRLIAVSTNDSINRIAVFRLGQQIFEDSPVLPETTCAYFRLDCHNIPSLDWSYAENGEDILVAQDIYARLQLLKISDILTHFDESSQVLAVECEVLGTGQFSETGLSWAMAALNPEFYMLTDTVEETFGNAYIINSGNCEFMRVDEKKYKQPQTSLMTFPELQQMSKEHELPRVFPTGILCTAGGSIVLSPIDHCEKISDPLARRVRSTSRKTCIEPDLFLADGIIDAEAPVEFQEFDIKLSLIAKIPQLCLVVVGSTGGRVALITPTCAAKNIVFKDLHIMEAGQISCRLEAILPSEEQENKGERPRTELVGIAAAPLQGKDERRFRLLLHYQDHSILSYELSRQTTEPL